MVRLRDSNPRRTYAALACWRTQALGIGKGVRHEHGAGLAAGVTSYCARRFSESEEAHGEFMAAGFKAIKNT